MCLPPSEPSQASCRFKNTLAPGTEKKTERAVATGEGVLYNSEAWPGSRVGQGHMEGHMESLGEMGNPISSEKDDKANDTYSKKDCYRV